MKSHYDFGKGERGKFYDPDAVFITPQEADLLKQIAQSLSQIEWSQPSQLWVNYNPTADSLTVYFTGQPVPSVWDDVDRFAYIGFALDDETLVTGVMIEHFSQWLLVTDQPGHQLQLA